MAFGNDDYMDLLEAENERLKIENERLREGIREAADSLGSSYEGYADVAAGLRALLGSDLRVPSTSRACWSCSDGFHAECEYPREDCECRLCHRFCDHDHAQCEASPPSTHQPRT